MRLDAKITTQTSLQNSLDTDGWDAEFGSMLFKTQTEFWQIIETQWNV